ncbi:hypothetical protein BN863_22880 [Formosa agariphila KMM 3901]|uniref:Uncharacterized protein n=1 Tax=Formosa agariphila (strain DSM 15362 / KCTC 12365 / LMG 23005 / KMM 3901 / M-2Alg 35-1) TaxID=1347342 RepID=T2KMN1_FORAG|nr:hypothetical protein BN863_22880 [Formosa agariphila KMM 3901]
MWSALNEDRRGVLNKYTFESLSQACEQNKCGGMTTSFYNS